MVKIVLGVIVGFITWSIFWLGSDQVLQIASPSWYGAHQQAFELAVANREPFNANSTILILHIIRSIIASLMAGFLAAVVSGENRRSPFALGIVLLVVGIVVEAFAWPYAPVWYHVIFIALLLPMTIFGGKLKRTSA